MKVLHINVGQPRQVWWNDRMLTTSIFKSSVNQKCKVTYTNVEGDRQANLLIHGGVDKAVYSYDIQYYYFWKNHIKRSDWDPGLFGENLTTEGLTDDKARIGDIFEIGTVKLMPVQPRFPCINLNARFELNDMIERFYNGERFGIYYRVIEEGYIEPNDKINLIEESKYNVTIKDLCECKTSKGSDQNILKQILDIPHIPDNLKNSLKNYLK